jgi:hypothetical protein
MFSQKMKLNEQLNKKILVQQEAMKFADSFGIEIELEGKNICQPSMEIMRFWSAVNDGSLRKLNPGDQAIEYVLRQPCSLQRTETAINTLFTYLTSPNAIVYPSYRTSIHVHVNYSQETYRTVYNAMVLSIILDELLTSQNGKHRIGNNFCLRSKDAMGQVIHLIRSIQQNNNFFGISPNERYSSINFASLMKFGSIEYRSLECTLHEGRVMHWIGTLQAIKDSAKTFKNPVEVIQRFSHMETDRWLKATLGPFSAKYLNVPGYQTMLYDGVRLAQDLAYCSEWNEAK